MNLLLTAFEMQPARLLIKRKFARVHTAIHFQIHSEFETSIFVKQKERHMIVSLLKVAQYTFLTSIHCTRFWIPFGSSIEFWSMLMQYDISNISNFLCCIWIWSSIFICFNYTLVIFPYNMISCVHKLELFPKVCCDSDSISTTFL